MKADTLLADLISFRRPARRSCTMVGEVWMYRY